MSFFWFALMVSLIILEANTAQLISIWFAGGSFFALICALCGLNQWVQATVFVISSAILLIFTRKIVAKLKTNKDTKTNIDALIGKSAVVLDDIVNLKESGSIKINGIIWSARSKTGEDIPKDTVVTVEEIIGVKLIVNKKED